MDSPLRGIDEVRAPLCGKQNGAVRAGYQGMIKILSYSVLIIFLIVIVTAKIIAPRVVVHQLISGVEKNCESCNISVTTSSLSYFPPGLRFSGVRFSGGNPKATAVTAEASQLSAEISLRHLISGVIFLSHIEIKSPKIDVVEGDLRSTPSPENDTNATHFAFKGIKLSDGSFTYTRVYGSRRAEIHTSDLQGSIDLISNLPEFSTHISDGEIKGQLEKSGTFNLKIDSPIFAKDLQVDVGLKLFEQNLADVSPFFQVDSGLKLTGLLHDSDSLMQIRKSSLHGWVFVQYEDLKIKVEETKDRGAIAAFFSNLISSAKMMRKDLHKRHRDQVRSVDLVRKEKETLIQFILRGLRDASLKVASNS